MSEKLALIGQPQSEINNGLEKLAAAEILPGHWKRLRCDHDFLLRVANLIKEADTSTSSEGYKVTIDYGVPRKERVRLVEKRCKIKFLPDEVLESLHSSWGEKTHPELYFVDLYCSMTRGEACRDLERRRLVPANADELIAVVNENIIAFHRNVDIFALDTWRQGENDREALYFGIGSSGFLGYHIYPSAEISPLRTKLLVRKM